MNCRAIRHAARAGETVAVELDLAWIDEARMLSSVICILPESVRLFLKGFGR